ncbi:hypothetical protein [Muricoccus radiodurans]|uniref:hypothetical protein n=1 Tax=Muricoccus radiodurans TaxID=2231721 RepID=UPI003CECCFBF
MDGAVLVGPVQCEATEGGIGAIAEGKGTARIRLYGRPMDDLSQAATLLHDAPEARGWNVLGVVWDGIVEADVLNEEQAHLRHKLADAGKGCDWPTILGILREHPRLANTTRLGGKSLYAPLHQAAYSGAPIEVVVEMIRLGAWRTLQNARGERAVDVAQRRGHKEIVRTLLPVLQRKVPHGILARVQAHFHSVIRGRASGTPYMSALRLPELEPLLELGTGSEPVWFAVPGMYGGFVYHLRNDGVEAVLISESWSRVVGGSGQRHEITSAGSRLVAEGFV